jgi:hypothetical protein
MRTESDWREGDLVSLHQAARYELRVRQAEQVLAVQGWIVVDRFGALKPHPLADLVLKMTNQKLLILRALGLTVSTDVKATSQRAAPTLADDRAVRARKGKLTLLATPGR